MLASLSARGAEKERPRLAPRPPTCVYANDLLHEDPTVGLRQCLNHGPTDGDLNARHAQVDDEREPTDRHGAVTHVERASALQGDRPVRIDGPARYPTGDRDPLAQADRTRSVDLHLEVALARTVGVRLDGDAERRAGELDTVEGRARGIHAGSRAGDDV